jgi:hypothetical protein
MFFLASRLTIWAIHRSEIRVARAYSLLFPLLPLVPDADLFTYSPTDDVTAGGAAGFSGSRQVDPGRPLAYTCAAHIGSQQLARVKTNYSFPSVCIA